MAKWSGYKRFCSLARGLDVIGERWTLLIIQEVGFGPLRYNELRRRLPGIGSNILADRLRKLEQHDILRRVPAAVGQGVRYELTPRGQGLTPALVELRKWGLSEQLMLDQRAEPVSHDMSYGVPDELDLHETYEWKVDDKTTTLTIDGGTLVQTFGPAKDPAVRITTSSQWMLELVSGRTDWNSGRSDGQVQATGTQEAWERMLVATAQPGANLEAALDSAWEKD